MIYQNPNAFHPSEDDVHAKIDRESFHTEDEQARHDGVTPHYSTWTHDQYMEAIEDNRRDAAQLLPQPRLSKEEAAELKRVMNRATEASKTAVGKDRDVVYCGECGKPLPCQHARIGKTYGY